MPRNVISRNGVRGIVNGVIAASEAELQEVINTYTLPARWVVITQGSKFVVMADDPGGELFLPEYQAVLDYATSQGWALPSDPENSANNVAIAEAINEGIWNLLDVWWPMKNNINFATINWKAPGTYNLGLVNSPSYNAATGFTGDGTTMHLTTGWIPNNSSLFLQDSAGIGCGITTNVDVGADFGVGEASFSNAILFGSRSGASAVSRFNGGGQLLDPNVNSIGRYHLRRISSADYSVFKNASLIGLNVRVSAGRAPFGLYILAYNSNGVTNSRTARSINYVWAGGPLTGLESTWDTILTNLYA